MPRKIQFTVPPEYDGVKTVTFLRSRCGVSSRLVGKLKKAEDGILLDGQRVRTIDKLKAGSTLEINIPDEGEAPVPVSAPLPSGISSMRSRQSSSLVTSRRSMLAYAII